MTEPRRSAAAPDPGVVWAAGSSTGAGAVAGSPVADLLTDKPHPARMYDAYLGGKDHYQADKDAAAKVMQALPTVPLAAQVNRKFMRRATRYLAAERGVHQFLDIGTGIPTPPNLHQVAQEVARDARVVYVDNDPLVLAHAHALMIGTAEGRLAYIEADVRDPDAILSAPQLTETLDLAKPVALSLVAVLHFVADDSDPHGIVATLRDALAPGSFLVMTHMASDWSPQMNKAAEVYRQKGMTCATRSRAEFARFFDGLDLVEPGICVPHRWRWIGVEPPKQMDLDASLWAGVGRKP